jgi:multisubunit Na+/H+ antiporter MnhG subunit
MRLDIRLPMGIFFSAIGLILVIFGLVGSKTVYTRSLGVNVNLAWGAVLVLFGVAMIALAFRAKARPGGSGDSNGPSRRNGEYGE